MSQGEIPALSEDVDARPFIEHPENWNMNEGPFAKLCSRLGNRFISLADREQARPADEAELAALGRISQQLRALGG